MKERAQQYARTANISGGIAVVGGIAGLTGVSMLAGKFFLGQTGFQANSPEMYGRIFIVALCAIAFIWGLRIVLRIFLNNLYLGTDAQERVTMIETYLTLEASDKKPSEAERLMILTAIFRPTGTSAPSDDLVPLSALEVVTRAVTRKPQP